MLRPFMAAGAVALVVALSLDSAAPLRAADDEEVIVLSRAVAVDYALYQRADDPGFFAISLDGATSTHIAHDGAWTDESVLAPIAGQAIAACEAKAGGVPCLIFARNAEIVLAVPYEIPHD
jgi:hypothetical protein